MPCSNNSWIGSRFVLFRTKLRLSFGRARPWPVPLKATRAHDAPIADFRSNRSNSQNRIRHFEIGSIAWRSVSASPRELPTDHRRDAHHPRRDSRNNELRTHVEALQLRGQVVLTGSLLPNQFAVRHETEGGQFCYSTSRQSLANESRQGARYRSMTEAAASAVSTRCPSECRRSCFCPTLATMAARRS